MRNLIIPTVCSVLGLILSLVLWLYFGSDQTSKYHFIAQWHYNPTKKKSEIALRPKNFKGIWKTYYKNGILTTEETVVPGKSLKIIGYDQEGVLNIKSVFLSSGKSIIERYYKTGSIMHQMINENDIFKYRKDFYESGELKTKTERVNAYERTFTEYLKNGEIKIKSLRTYYKNKGKSLNTLHIYDVSILDYSKYSIEYFDSNEILQKTEFFEKGKLVKTETEQYPK
ncbi:MAG: hypothetical protein COA79_26295 [Planctomycetota bacterium]|nr:MAG: hypothetical protein COA79_26295 [Planctomycetota bacterium]